VAQLELNQGNGTAKLGDAEYRVQTLHQTRKGKQEKAALGYWFTQPAGEGAIDLAGDGRFWLPPQLSAEQEPAMLCLYASLFVYRPSQAL
jgi:hypothetical protein